MQIFPMDKIGLESYPQGVPAAVDVKQLPLLVERLSETFRQHGAKTACKFMG